jgi:hypothetical protein
MPRPSIRDSIAPSVLEYCKSAESSTPEEQPLTVLAMSKRLSIDRRTLKKYFSQEIADAQLRQKLLPQLTARQLERRSYADMLRDRDNQIEILTNRNKQLLERLALVEVNAARICINPEELYKPTRKPNRSVSRAGSTRRP